MSPLVDKAFRKWLENPTWHTCHPSDDERFYRFVWTVIQYSRKAPSEEYIRTRITTNWSGKLETDYLEKMASHFSGLYATLYDFAKTRTKPEPFLLSAIEGHPLTSHPSRPAKAGG